MESLISRISLFLNELNFVTSQDVDYTFSDIVITSDGSDEYKLSGKTHGKISHALKHLIEFDSAFVIKKLKTVKEIFQKNENNLLFLKRGRGKIDPVYMSDDIILTSLDYINDKLLMKEKLSEVETSIVPILKEIESKYDSIVTKIVSSSIHINDNESEENIIAKMRKGPISFNVSFGDEKVYLDLKTGAFIITSKRLKNSVKTAFKLTGGKARALTILDKRIVDNPNVLLAIRNFR